jgi:succinoglycan biosynthesis transport protein ExoP
VQSQLEAILQEIDRHKQEQARLSKLAATYQAKLESIPVREQQVANLVRDYEISKTHYNQLLNNQLSAETATQLEIRQKGERPSSPNRSLIDLAGSGGGLGLGLLLALITEFLGITITAPAQVTEATGIPVLEVIPLIDTFADRRIRRRHLWMAALSGAVLTVLACGVFVFRRYGG